MNTLCIISLFFAAVIGLPIKHIDTAFITQEGATDDLLAMIEQLRQDNVDALAHATDAAAAALDELNSANNALDAATFAEDTALGNWQEGVASLKSKKSVAAGKTAVERDARNTMDKAQDEATKAAEILASETVRLDEEKATLEEVVDLITTLAESAALQLSDSNKRNLLSIVDLSSLANADPTAVEEVKQLLIDLIAAGEDERTKATDARDTTAASLVRAQDAHKITYDDLAVALGEVKFQEETNVELREICDEAIKVKNDAVDAQENAAQVSSNADGHQADEETRTDDEESTFKRVEALLSTLE
jgi:hypothetical protein